MKKVLAGMILYFLVFTGVFIPNPTVSANQEWITTEVKFSDLSNHHRFYKEIQYLVNNSIISGFPDGTFSL